MPASGQFDRMLFFVALWSRMTLRGDTTRCAPGLSDAMALRSQPLSVWRRPPPQVPPPPPWPPRSPGRQRPSVNCEPAPFHAVAPSTTACGLTAIYEPKALVARQESSKLRIRTMRREGARGPRRRVVAHLYEAQKTLGVARCRRCTQFKVMKVEASVAPKTKCISAQVPAVVHSRNVR